MMARLEGVVFDPVYAGKAFAGLLGMARNGVENVLFMQYRRPTSV